MEVVPEQSYVKSNSETKGYVGRLESVHKADLWLTYRRAVSSSGYIASKSWPRLRINIGIFQEGLGKNTKNFKV
jgi:hypothetical protein